MMMLPVPDPAFHWTAEAWGPALRCRRLSTVAQHAFTTKQLQLRGGPSASPDGWTEALASVGAGLEQLIRVRQVHAASVRVLKEGEIGPADVAALPEADAMVSNAKGYVLSVQVADCVPILIADRKGRVAAAVHAGWRGTCARVAPAAVDTMTRDFGIDPADLLAAIGPSIGPCCYEVGSSVLDAFTLADADEERVTRWFARDERGALRLDLWAANRDQLLDAGLRADHVDVSRLCTQTHHDVFESYRVEGTRAGRMAALIAVP